MHVFTDEDLLDEKLNEKLFLQCITPSYTTGAWNKDSKYKNTNSTAVTIAVSQNLVTYNFVPNQRQFPLRTHVPFLNCHVHPWLQSFEPIMTPFFLSNHYLGATVDVIFRRDNKKLRDLLLAANFSNPTVTQPKWFGLSHYSIFPIFVYSQMEIHMIKKLLMKKWLKIPCYKDL